MVWSACKSAARKSRTALTARAPKAKHMPYYLLTGAGFSRNWGGWLSNEVFEYLLGCPELDQYSRNLLWNTKLRHGGFEDTLSALQGAAEAQPTEENMRRLRAMNDALAGMFTAIDRQSARPHHPAHATHPRRRGDRIAMLFAAVHWSLLAQSGHSRHCNNLSAIGV
jgi:hypothetical protein